MNPPSRRGRSGKKEMSASIRYIAALATAAVVVLPLTGCSGEKNETTCHSGAFCGNGNKGNSIDSSADAAETPSPSSDTTNTAPADKKVRESSTEPPKTEPDSPGTSTRPEVQKCGEDCQWRDWTAIPGVQVRPTWVREGNDLYMVAEWRSSSERSLDVWIWLKDGSGNKALYPVDPPAIGFHQMRTTSEGFSRKVKVGIPLEPGRRYNISISVAEYRPHQTGPNISNPSVDGMMENLLYT